MEKPDEKSVARWTDERMATLTPDANWQPDVGHGLVRLRAGRQLESAPRSRWNWVAVGAAVATVLVMSTPIGRAFAERCGEFLMRSLTGNGPTRTYARLGQRQAMPDFTLNDVSGHPVRLSDLRGKVVLLNFWTT